MYGTSFLPFLSVLALHLPVTFGLPQSLPTVDLGYQIHQAIAYNSTGQYYNFTNIRYAAPPTGERRFKVPQLPLEDRSKVQTGTIGASCPQAEPDYLTITPQFFSQWSTTGTYNISTFNKSAPNPFPAAAGPISEDCLFLDVQVPKSVFTKTQYGKHSGAPVVVWIYGGSFTFGSKTHWGSPAGLLAESKRLSGDVVYVAINYRLGAFGWLSGPTIDSNAGLYDQRMALEWVQKYIHLFGGDPKQVTVMGESAGGGSAVLQLTAFGGAKGPVPFKRVIPQSPATAMVQRGSQELLLKQFLAAANVSTIEEARDLPIERLIEANQRVVAPGAFGTTIFGPVVDGNFVPERPGKLLLHGSFDKNVEVMAGHNADEGILMVDPYIMTEIEYKRFLDKYLPDLSKSKRDYITTELYPPIFDGSQGYTSQIERNGAQMSELVITCNQYYIQTANNKHSRGYLFSVPPATHGQDITYTFYNGPDVNVPFPDVAKNLQDSIVRFVVNGTAGLIGWPEYGSDHTVMNFNITSPSPIRSPVIERRCLWWQKELDT